MTRHTTSWLLLLLAASCAPTQLTRGQSNPDPPVARGNASPTASSTSMPATSAPQADAVLSLELAERLTAGGIHNCFIDDVGKTRCWGNPLGKPRGVPLELEGLSRATKVASGYDSACARTVAGTVECWGEDFEVNFRGLENVKDIATGSTFDCSIHDDATVSCWGALEPGSTKVYPPRKLALQGARAIAVGHYEGCVIDESDRVLCFGLGSASLESENYPPNHFHHGATREGSWVVASAVKLPGIHAQPSVRGNAGSLFAPCHARELATTPELSGHAVLKIEWGKAGQRFAALRGQAPHVTLLEQSFSGELGERMRACLVEKGQLFPSVPGTAGVRLDFAPMLSRALQPRHILDGAISLDMFGYFGCAITRDHELACWQSSYAFDTKEAEPEVLGGAAVEWVEGVENAVQVAVGLRHVCVRFEDGSIACFGDPEAVGVGPSDEFGLTHVNLKHETKHLMAGALHTCVATDPPQVLCWGYGGRGGIGKGATEHRVYGPAPVDALPLPTAW